MNDECLKFLRYGNLAATIICSGFIHPDMHEKNIIMAERGYVFCDYADAKRIQLPDGLNDNMVRQLTESLFPLVDATKESFLYCSHLRAGLLARGGFLLSGIFSNAINMGFSSATFLKHPFALKRITVDELFTKFQLVREWQALELDSFDLGWYNPKAQSSMPSNIKDIISKENYYYFNRLIFVMSCFMAKDDSAYKIPYATSLHNMACSARESGKYYIEYGLLKKCLKTYSGIPMLEEQCKGMIFSLLQSWECNTDCVDYIDSVIDELDLFEFMWVLDDIELYNK